MYRRIVIAAILTVGLFTAFPVHAAKYDLSLWRFCQRGADGWCVADPSNPNKVLTNQGGFESFAKQFAAVIAPKFHAPAETLGYAGFNLGLEVAVNQIPGGDNWADALQGVERFPNLNYGGGKDGSAPSMLNTLRFHARKGLPYSMELGMNVNYVIGSQMFTFGGEFKFAFFEGFKYYPDFAVRMTYDHLFNSEDLDMDLWNWDLSVSKNFGVAGFLQLCPYTGYSVVLMRARPHVANPTFDPYNNDRLLLLDGITAPIHRWFLGLRMMASYVSFSPEIIISSESVYNYSFNLGVDF